MNGALGATSGGLPDELMSLIFLNCLETDDIGCVTPSSTSAPLLPSWVCRRWRRICLSTPQLWTGVNLQDLTREGLYAVNRTVLLSLLDLWIRRSRSCSISIRFSYTDLSDAGSGMMLFLPGPNDDSAYLRDIRALIQRLLSCQHRWRALDVTVLDLSTVEPLLQAVSARPASPRLEYLSIATQYLGIFGEIRTYNLQLASHLRTLRIMSPLIVPEGNGVQFERLSELTLKYCSSMMGCLQWIDKAPNLETLRVRFFGAGGESFENGTRTRRLRKLVDLQISSFSSDSDPTAFINLLELPALEELFFDMNDLIESRSWSCVLELLKRSRPRALQALALLGTPMSQEDILACLRMSPKLTYLNLGTVTDNILDALSASAPCQPKSSTPLCPSLEVLEIADVTDCSAASLVNFASSRCRDKSDDVSAAECELRFEGDNRWETLETLVIPCDPDYDLIGHPDIMQCVAKGLSVEHKDLAFDILPPRRLAQRLTPA
ncbi:hypothetical protein ACEPAF_9101 [Sanghuangporus sanghuang]